MSKPLIKTHDLARHYTRGEELIKALDGVDLEIAQGEFVSLVGPSGSGKSTLLNLIGGLVRPTRGELWVGEIELGSCSDVGLVAYRRDTLGFIFQNFNLLPIKTAWENVAVPLMLAGVAQSQRRVRAEELLALVGLAKRGDHRPSELSGGEQQRVAIARALANRPKLIIADEPTGNLDSRTGGEIMNNLRRLVSEEGVTLVLVTHDMGVAGYADRIVHLRDGKVESVEINLDRVTS
ncbi:MAG: ABC transporter ATP-binding protein [Oscillochloris sp.]|nr:ABC transporter ATP-binding protein [Oscillochloris sp.]